jgi:cytochrome c-type biogenesis protein
MYDSLSLWVAFVGGLVSFLSPCILPLVPGFLTYLAGSSLDQADKHRREIFVNSIFFVLGFSVIFSLIGVLLSTVLASVAYSSQLWLSRIGGLIIIFFGLYLTGLIQPKFLQAEHKLAVRKQFSSRYLTSFVFGAAFAGGWTPCVGAVLGTIFGLAVSKPATAFFMLLAYSIGLGVPFLLLGYFTSYGARVIRSLGRWLKPINISFGILLIILGVLVFTQQLLKFANFSLVLRLFE